MQLVCSSKITHVTVHARGALVTRYVTVPAMTEATGPDAAPSHPGELDLIIDHLTPLAEPGSVRATLVAGTANSSASSPPSSRQIIAVQSSLIVPETTAAVGPSTARVQELLARLARLQVEIERLQDRRQQLGQLMPDPVLRTTSLVEKVDVRIADALATTQLAFEVQTEIDQRLRVLEKELAEVQLQHAAAELEQSQSPSSARTGSGHPSRRVTVRVAGSGPVRALELSYVVPAARFWPIYTLRIVDGAEGKRRATWLIEALVAQQTGEDWRDVRLGLSTADLSYDARLPELPSLRLGRVQPSVKRGYRPPPTGLEALFAGYDRVFSSAPGIAAPPHDLPDLDEEAERLMLSNSALELTVPGEDELLDDIPTAAQEKKGGSRPHGGSARPQGAGGPPAPSKSMMAALDGAMPDMPPPPGRAAPAPMGYAPQSFAMAPARRAEAPAEELKVARSGAPKAKRMSASLGGGGAYEKEAFDDEGGYGGSAPGLGAGGESEPAPLEPQDSWLDFDRLTMAGVEDAFHRGRLLLRPERGGSSLRRRATERIEALSPPGGVRDPQDSRGRFDHRFDAEGLVRVPSDGQTHRVSLLSAETTPALRLLAVPRERPEVYRESELRNPCEAPLLAGPVDVYVEGSLLTTAAIEHIDRGGTLRVGMGVEERVRVARNVRAEEETAGLLGGSTMVTHSVSIELSSVLGQAIPVEVQERLPVSDDKSVVIELLAARPEAHGYTQAERGAPIRGGMLWRLTLPAGGKAKIEYQYRVTFPARTEIVGGNRRD